MMRCLARANSPASLLFEQRGQHSQAGADRLERRRGLGRTGNSVDEQALDRLRGDRFWGQVAPQIGKPRVQCETYR